MSTPETLSLDLLDDVAIKDMYTTASDPETIVVLGMGITLVMKGSPDVLPGMIDVINEYFALTEGKLVGISKGSKAPVPFNAKEWPIPHMTPDEFFDKGYSLLRAVSSTSHDQPGHFQICAKFRDRDFERSILHVAFPMGFVLAQKPGFFINLLHTWSAKLNPLHGYAGFNANIPMIDLTMERHADGTLYHVLRRFPGLNFVTLSDYNYFERGMKSADWFTFVHNSFLEKIGGQKAFDGLDKEHFTVHTYPEGVMVQAGTLPELGDFKQGIVPRYYPAVHNIIKPLYFPLKTSVLIPDDAFEASHKEFAEKWRNRFEPPIPFTEFRV